MGRARDEVVNTLKKMRAAEFVISSNIALRRDGLPYVGSAEPDDVGVAVYWTERKWVDGKQIVTPRVMACDRWRKVQENIRAIGLALEAMRALERSGASQVFERAYASFGMLPPAKRTKPWREVLGIPLDVIVTPSHINSAWRELARIHHPDKSGGSTERMAEINRARDEALADPNR